MLAHLSYVDYAAVLGIPNFGLDQSSSKILETTITEENLKDIELFFAYRYTSIEATD